LPDYIIIEFPGYEGNSCIENIKAIPITPVEHKFEVNGKVCKRM